MTSKAYGFEVHNMHILTFSDIQANVNNVPPSTLVQNNTRVKTSVASLDILYL